MLPCILVNKDFQCSSQSHRNRLCDARGLFVSRISIAYRARLCLLHQECSAVSKTNTLHTALFTK